MCGPTRRVRSRLARVAVADDYRLTGHKWFFSAPMCDAHLVLARAPDMVIGSWCGKKFRPDKVAARPGWSALPAVRDAQIFEIKSADILQPGPAALTDGFEQLHELMKQWVEHYA